MRHSTTVTQTARREQKSCVATLLFASFMFGCVSSGDHYEEWTAQGYLTPGPTGQPEIIGIFETEAECVAAGQAWMSRQVVGNPVYADCLPVDRH
ncbi:MAG: hypothetical protein AAFW68_07605 [Pseudomonadota bacterium]